jgi:hypothetical protein
MNFTHRRNYELPEDREELKPRHVGTRINE